MKLKFIAGMTMALTLVYTGVANARGDYMPPERIQCTIDNMHKPSCKHFNRNYLIENTSTANATDKADTYHFFQASAFFENKTTASVFLTYYNAKSEMVKLKTISAAIMPDLHHSSWKRVTDDLYRCVDIETNCPVTHLPA